MKNQNTLTVEGKQSHMDTQKVSNLLNVESKASFMSSSKKRIFSDKSPQLKADKDGVV